MVFFSIIIACHNAENYIQFTLDSVLQQSFKNYEVLIVDDVSTDNTEPLDILSFCNTKGYTPLDILSFCNKFKIRCFGYNFKMERFITNTDKNIVFNPNLPAFVYYFKDEHIYLINDKQMRHSLLNDNSSKSDIISLLSKERKIEDSKTPKNI
jgi:glycosyltransferase involved in cell wall biosynthesis